MSHLDHRNTEAFTEKKTTRLTYFWQRYLVCFSTETVVVSQQALIVSEVFILRNN